MKIGRFGKNSAMSPEDYNDPPKPFLQHLVELRDCLVKCAAAWIVCVIAIIPFTPKINSWIMAPAYITPADLGVTVVSTPDSSAEATNDGGLGQAALPAEQGPVAESREVGRARSPSAPQGSPEESAAPLVRDDQPIVQVQGLTWTVGFSVMFKIMIWGGTAIAMPFLLFFLMQFIFPGLKRGEKNVIVFSMVASTVFFLGGVAMAYATTLRIALRVFLQVNKWMGIPTTIVTMDEHISLVIKTIVAFGLAFQLPLLVLALGWIGLISAEALARRRRIAIVVIFILAMVLTPPDPLSQIVMAVPMCLLYEACIWIIRAREKAKTRR